jgi:hypothetical protein
MFRTFSAEHLVTHRSPDETECAFDNPVLYLLHRQASGRSLAPECRRPPFGRELADEALGMHQRRRAAGAAVGLMVVCCRLAAGPERRAHRPGHRAAS